MNPLFRLSRVAQVCAGMALVAVVQVAAAQDAEVVMRQGRVEVQDPATGLWREALPKQPLKVGDALRTGEASQAALLVKDRTQVRLNERSSFVLKAAGDEQGGTQLELTSGRMWAQAKQFTTGLLRATTGLLTSRPKLAVNTPTATIGIRGTDWEITVDEQGDTQVVVFSGEVAVANDQGEVLLGPSEQSTVRRGQAPTKAVLAQAQDRVQWVNALRLDVDAYPDLAQAPQAQALREALAAQRIATARDLLDAWLAGAASQAPAGAWLLAADMALMAGDLPRVQQRLDAAARSFPADDRIPAYQARVALFRGDIAAARDLVQAAQPRFPASAELALVAAELARLDGQGADAVARFQAVSQERPQDLRAWSGLGNTLAEQEDFGPARQALQQALSLAPGQATPLADLGTLETRAQRLPQAQTYIAQALAIAPDDYVAWTAQGILLLTQGQPDAALQALLKAGLLEPRYAKAQVYTAIAWYQLGREDAALTALDRAKKADPQDPLPYIYEAQIHRDHLQPMEALAASREAMARFPYLKSLGPIASDRQGSANLGSAYAMLGLEAWAQRMAQQSQHPFFAASHLFVADRTSDAFVKNSSLLQGFLTDPTVFGASPQRSTLMATPGLYGALEAGYTRSPASRQTEPGVIANGYGVSPMPLAAFMQYTAPRVQAGDVALNGRGPSGVVALGFKPQAHLGVFLYHEAFRPRFDRLAIFTANERLWGEEQRTQLGAQWQLDPKTALWLMAGQAEGQTQIQSQSQTLARQTHTDTPEWGLRYTALRDSGEWSLVAEHSKMTQTRVQTSTGRVSSLAENLHVQARSHSLTGSWKRHSGALLTQLDLNYADFEFTRDEFLRTTRLSSGSSSTQTLPVVQRSIHRLSPSLGLAWSPNPATTYRLAYQDITRAAGASSLAPQDTAGISLDVPGLEPGGRLRRWRVQGEWELGGTTFVKAFADHRRLHNLQSENGNLLNETVDLSQLRRLRQQGVGGPDSMESLAGQQAPVARGVVRATGVIVEGLAGSQWGWSVGYLHHQTQNQWLPGVSLPDYPRHTVRLGLSWFAPQRWVIRTALVGRSERTADVLGKLVLQPDWDLALSASWQDARKQRSFEVYTTGQLRKGESPVYGVRGVWRF